MNVQNKKLFEATKHLLRIKNTVKLSRINQDWYLKWTFPEKTIWYKKIKNECNTLLRKWIKSCFQENTEEDSTSSKPVWNTVKPFTNTKRTLSNYDIIIEAKNDNTINDLASIKTKNEIRDENVLVKMFKSL